ncbi:hypothetical protein OsJ_01447 [Oryza sativa Japonica Group]|uniref:Uncharacterized protein n=2 Tax=Oryza TaxID=4527 RepID=A2ZS86_ORYSJ|nr:hypothetical protein OsJ_01447 [Oryza sativa Japonica Group]
MEHIERDADRVEVEHREVGEGRGDPPEKSGREVDPVKHEARRSSGQQRGRRCLTSRSTGYSSFSSWVSGVNSTSSECPTSCDRMASCHHRKSTDMRMALSSGRISRAFSPGSSRSVARRR